MIFQRKMNTEEQTARLYSSIFKEIPDDDFLKKSESFIKRIKIKPGWFTGKRCLDAGCGPGFAAYGLSEINHARVYAIDISEGCLSIARRMVSAANNIFFSRASVESIPFKDSSFDFVNCNGVLHHLLNTQEAISELFRVLKPGGIIFIGVYGAGGLLNEFKICLYRFLAKFIPYDFMRRALPKTVKNELLDNLYVPVRKAFSEKGFKQLLEESGFSNIERVAEGFYRRPANLREKVIIGPDGMYMHFLAEKQS